MSKRWMILLLALLSTAVPALAETYAGKTAALSTEAVRAENGGTVESVLALEGQRVGAGDAIVQLKPEKTFATQDGTVSLVSAGEGDAVNGEVLQIAPAQRYTIYCTTDKAYQSADTTLVHAGERVYIKCTADGTHRAIGVIDQIDGAEYRVMTIGGELYIGETVYLYRDSDYTTALRVGIGTVVSTDTEAYSAEGRITGLRVSAGDAVERGQLLYETDGGTVEAEAGGIVTGIACQPGDTVQAGQVVAQIAPEDAVVVEIQVDEASAGHIAIGDSAQLVFAGQDEEDASTGSVIAISGIAESESYVVQIQPDANEALALGMDVEVRLP